MSETIAIVTLLIPLERYAYNIYVSILVVFHYDELFVDVFAWMLRNLSSVLLILTELFL